MCTYGCATHREAESTCPCLPNGFVTPGQPREAIDVPGTADNTMVSLSKGVPLLSLGEEAPVRKHNYVETKLPIEEE